MTDPDLGIVPGTSRRAKPTDTTHQDSTLVQKINIVSASGAVVTLSPLELIKGLEIPILVTAAAAGGSEIQMPAVSAITSVLRSGGGTPATGDRICFRIINHSGSTLTFGAGNEVLMGSGMTNSVATAIPDEASRILILQYTSASAATLHGATDA